MKNQIELNTDNTMTKNEPVFNLIIKKTGEEIQVPQKIAKMFNIKRDKEIEEIKNNEITRSLIDKTKINIEEEYKKNKLMLIKTTRRIKEIVKEIEKENQNRKNSKNVNIRLRTGEKYMIPQYVYNQINGIQEKKEDEMNDNEEDGGKIYGKPEIVKEIIEMYKKIFNTIDNKGEAKEEEIRKIITEWLDILTENKQIEEYLDVARLMRATFMRQILRYKEKKNEIIYYDTEDYTENPQFIKRVFKFTQDNINKKVNIKFKDGDIFTITKFAANMSKVFRKAITNADENENPITINIPETDMEYDIDIGDENSCEIIKQVAKECLQFCNNYYHRRCPVFDNPLKLPYKRYIIKKSKPSKETKNILKWVESIFADKTYDNLTYITKDFKVKLYHLVINFADKYDIKFIRRLISAKIADISHIITDKRENNEISEEECTRRLCELWTIKRDPNYINTYEARADPILIAEGIVQDLTDEEKASLTDEQLKELNIDIEQEKYEDIEDDISESSESDSEIDSEKGEQESEDEDEETEEDNSNDDDEYISSTDSDDSFVDSDEELYSSDSDDEENNDE